MTLGERLVRQLKIGLARLKSPQGKLGPIGAGGQYVVELVGDRRRQRAQRSEAVSVLELLLELFELGSCRIQLLLELIGGGRSSSGAGLPGPARFARAHASDIG